MKIQEAVEYSNNGARLPLCECFATLQGEGFYTGRSVVFVRLSGCDVGCPWCDTKDSWSVEQSDFVDIADLLAKITVFCTKCVVITGGEPTRYNLEPLIDILHSRGYEINIETSGTGHISPKIDWVALSPKLFKLPLPQSFAMANELKVVIEQESDFLMAEQYADKVSDSCKLFLQPQWQKSESLNLIIAYIMSNEKWRLSLQTHKYIGIE